jgi:hypothetical protein
VLSASLVRWTISLASKCACVKVESGCRTLLIYVQVVLAEQVPPEIDERRFISFLVLPDCFLS